MLLNQKAKTQKKSKNKGKVKKTRRREEAGAKKKAIDKTADIIVMQTQTAGRQKSSDCRREPTGRVTEASHKSNRGESVLVLPIKKKLQRDRKRGKRGKPKQRYRCEPMGVQPGGPL